jgi:hypothetical protein
MDQVAVLDRGTAANDRLKSGEPHIAPRHQPVPTRSDRLNDLLQKSDSARKFLARWRFLGLRSHEACERFDVCLGEDGTVQQRLTALLGAHGRFCPQSPQGHVEKTLPRRSRCPSAKGLTYRA